MPKTDGEVTRERILQVAERLFAENGFDGTGVEKIAKETGINKGSIYYHFKDKKDIIDSLFENIIEEVEEYLNMQHQGDTTGIQMVLEDKIKAEIDYLSCKEKILSVLFMEALKSGNSSDSFFKCGEAIIKHELSDVDFCTRNEDLRKEDVDKFIVSEFFTGIIPIIAFITLKDKWCKYFNIDEDKLMEYFVEAFMKTHIHAHK